MFTDPQSVTISGAAKSLSRVPSGPDGGSFATSTRDYRLTVTQNYGRRTRRTIRLFEDKLVSNPLISGQNINQTVQVGFFVDAPNGADATALKAVADGLVAYLAASSGAQITKLIGGEA